MTSSPLQLRILTRKDLPFADRLRALAGWNQTIADWERFLAAEPAGCFLAEWNGAPAGTATTFAYGPALGWIGMMLVHPEFRRRGIGRALLERSLEHLRGRGVHCVKLDATPVGRTVYDNLGFKEEWTLTRWERAGRRPTPTRDSGGIREWREADAAAVDSFDTAAFGVSRVRLLAALAAQRRRGFVAVSGTRSVTGYGLSRMGSNAVYLGPVVAESSGIALRIIELLTEHDGDKVIWDLPDQNSAAVEWARRNGFAARRKLTRMYHGENSTPGQPRDQFAIAGPEVG